MLCTGYADYSKAAAIFILANDLNKVHNLTTFSFKIMLNTTKNPKLFINVSLKMQIALHCYLYKHLVHNNCLQYDLKKTQRNCIILNSNKIENVLMLKGCYNISFNLVDAFSMVLCVSKKWKAGRECSEKKGCVGDETSHICTKLLQSNPLRTNKNKRNESSWKLKWIPNSQTKKIPTWGQNTNGKWKQPIPTIHSCFVLNVSEYFYILLWSTKLGLTK